MDGKSWNKRLYLLQLRTLFTVLCFVPPSILSVLHFQRTNILRRSSLQNSTGVDIIDKFKVKLLISLISKFSGLQTQKMKTIKCSIVCTALRLLLVEIYVYILKTFNSNF